MATLMDVHTLGAWRKGICRSTMPLYPTRGQWLVTIQGAYGNLRVLNRYAPLLVTVHLRMPLMPTTVDKMSVFKASRARPRLEWVWSLISSQECTEFERSQKLQTEVARVEIVMIVIGTIFFAESERGCKIFDNLNSKKTNSNYELIFMSPPGI